MRAAVGSGTTTGEELSEDLPIPGLSEAARSSSGKQEKPQLSGGAESFVALEDVSQEQDRARGGDPDSALSLEDRRPPERQPGRFERITQGAPFPREPREDPSPEGRSRPRAPPALPPSPISLGRALAPSSAKGQAGFQPRRRIRARRPLLGERGERRRRGADRRGQAPPTRSPPSATRASVRSAPAHRGHRNRAARGRSYLA